MTSTLWEYFGRRGPTNEVFELYRMPVGVKSPTERLASKQRLRKGLFWLDAGDDPALGNEWLSGWFNFEEDKLTEAQANALIQAWAQADDWPGRP